MYTLFLDESGLNNLNGIDPSRPHFLVGGLIFQDDQRLAIQHMSEFIKTKYWDDKYHILHAADGTHLETSDHKKYLSDLHELLSMFDFRALVSSINKNKFIQAHPPISNALTKYKTQKGFQSIVTAAHRQITVDCAYEALTMFLYFLHQNNFNGRVVVEATSGEQDKSIIDAYNLLLTGHQQLQISYRDVRRLITSISFVTKKNLDIETQIADMIVYLSNKKLRELDGIKKMKNGFEKETMKILDTKFFQYKKNSNPLSQELSSFRILY